MEAYALPRSLLNGFHLRFRRRRAAGRWATSPRRSASGGPLNARALLQSSGAEQDLQLQVRLVPAHAFTMF